MDHVGFRGPLPHHRTLPEMARPDAVVLASRMAVTGDQEGTPTVLIEAQALELPVVSTRHAGIPEVVPRSNHNLLVSERDAPTLADRLGWLASLAPKERAALGRRGRAWVEAEFALSSEVGRLRAVCREALRSPRLASARS